jgi:3-methyl-2-oxobutanoate hydroxymethyltransferase
MVLHDLLGLAEGKSPRFVRRYAELGSIATEAVRAWGADVRAGRYPSETETYHASVELREALAELPS